MNLKSSEPAQTFEFLKNREKIVDKIDFNRKPTKKVQFIVVNQKTQREKKRKEIRAIQKTYSKNIRTQEVIHSLRIT